MMMRVIHLIVKLCLVMAMTQCGDIHVSERKYPIIHLSEPLPKRHRQFNAEYYEAYQSIVRARQREKHAPREAMGLYLDAVKIAYQSHDEKLLPLYNHAVGQVADLMVQMKGVTSTRYRGKKTFYKLTLPTARRGEFPMANVDDILPADCLKCKSWRAAAKQRGVGSPVVVRRWKGSISGVDEHFATPVGQSYAATAVIEFSPGGEPEMRFYNPTKKDRVHFWGEQRTLSIDLTSPLVVSLHEGTTLGKEILLKWFGVFMPMHFVDQMGLYMTTPFDPEKIPVVLVHGLKSDPSTWRNVINKLNTDPELRKKYQFIVFYYPTGLPLRVPSAALKREINKLYGHYQKVGMQKNADEMVVIGHSLGGLLTSIQVRQIEKNLLGRVFKNPIKKTDVNQVAMKDYSYIINGPKPHFVKRVVFISTPHRGSRSANFYVARLLSSLVNIPKNVLFLKVPATTAALTDFGRTLFGADQKQNSLSILKSHSATLSVVGDSPFYKHIKYHSIMGDRGRGNTPDSSDGVVAYESSHLEGAQSEKVVPSRHRAHHHPEAIQEMGRILRLHLHEK